MTNKLKWILGITLIFTLILATNYIDRNNFRRIQESIETIYEDRVVAQQLIFEMSLILQHKVQRSLLPDTVGSYAQNSADQIAMKNLLDRFHQTRLTPKEALTLDNYQDDLARLENMEINGISNDNRMAYTGLLEKMNQHILVLSQIQLDEGKRQVHISERVVRSIDLLTTYEIYFLAFLALLIQILVLYKPKSNEN